MRKPPIIIMYSMVKIFQITLRLPVITKSKHNLNWQLKFKILLHKLRDNKVLFFTITAKVNQFSQKIC